MLSETKKRKRGENKKARFYTSVCPKCFQLEILTAYHIYPPRFFGKGKHNSYRIRICENCQQEIEGLTPKKTKLTKEQYVELIKLWFKGEHPLIKLL